MYRVTLQAGSAGQISLRVANQDLGRMMALAVRIQALNPQFDIQYVPEEARSSDAA